MKEYKIKTGLTIQQAFKLAADGWDFKSDLCGDWNGFWVYGNGQYFSQEQILCDDWQARMEIKPTADGFWSSEDKPVPRDGSTFFGEWKDVSYRVKDNRLEYWEPGWKPSGWSISTITRWKPCPEPKPEPRQRIRVGQVWAIRLCDFYAIASDPENITDEEFRKITGYNASDCTQVKDAK